MKEYSIDHPEEHFSAYRDVQVVPHLPLLFPLSILKPKHVFKIVMILHLAIKKSAIL